MRWQSQRHKVRYDFSFSGLKSSVLQFTKRMERQNKAFDLT